MAAESRAELVITATTKAAKRAVSDLSDAAKDAGDRFKSGFEKAGRAIEVFNQGMELVAKGRDLLIKGFELTLQKMSEMSRESSTQRKQLDELTGGMNKLGATIGGLILPILVGFNEGMSDAAGSTETYIRANKELLRIKIIEFLAKASRILITGIAVGASAASKAWLGWQLIIEVVKTSVNLFFEAILKGTAEVLDGLARVGRLSGTEVGAKIAAGADQASKAMKGLGDQFGSSGAAAAKRVLEINNQIAETEKEIERLKAAAEAGIDRGVAAALKRAGAEIGEFRTELEKANEELAKTRKEEHLRAIGERLDAEIAAAALREQLAQEALERIAENAARVKEIQDKQQEELRERLKEQQEELRASAESAASETVGFAKDMIKAATEGANAMDILVGVIDRMVTRLAEAVATGFFEQLLQFSVGGAGGGGAFGFIGGLFGFAGGGIAPDQPLRAANGLLVPGVGGTDSQLVATTPGEGILDPASTKAVLDGRAVVTTPEAASRGQGTQEIHIHTLEPSRARLMRVAEDSVAPAFLELAMRGSR